MQRGVQHNIIQFGAHAPEPSGVARKAGGGETSPAARPIPILHVSRRAENVRALRRELLMALIWSAGIGAIVVGVMAGAGR